MRHVFLWGKTRKGLGDMPQVCGITARRIDRRPKRAVRIRRSGEQGGTQLPGEAHSRRGRAAVIQGFEKQRQLGGHLFFGIDAFVGDIGLDHH